MPDRDFETRNLRAVMIKQVFVILAVAELEFQCCKKMSTQIMEPFSLQRIIRSSHPLSLSLLPSDGVCKWHHNLRLLWQFRFSLATT